MSDGPVRLDAEERRILADFERGKFRRIRNFDGEKKDIEKAARHAMLKDKRINIRISSRDLERIQKRAAREGMPYQTYISSALHKLVSSDETLTGNLRKVRPGDRVSAPREFPARRKRRKR